jgi:class 3 adenylate cyclase/predicted ATPase
MGDLRSWLEGHGLEALHERLVAHGIDLDVLADLTEGDLREAGLLLGDRRRLLKAIRGTPAPGESPATPPPLVTAAAQSSGEPTGPTQPLEERAERRQLTVMFVDLVGSTSLASHLDPEEMRGVIRGYQNLVAGEITRLQGHVAQFLGDGVLAYFGWPVTHEDEAERAVRSGLAIVKAVGRLRTHDAQPLTARVGIATGLVVVGDLIGAGRGLEETAVGNTPNLAARLQSIARPGQVVVSETTARLVEGAFELENLGPQELKGFDPPTPAFAVHGERQAATRFEMRAGDRLRPMVGREHELGLLRERWAQAIHGEGQGVLLVGEAGIGKSRIMRALIDSVGDLPHVRLRYQCSPYHSDTALWPVVQQLMHATRINPEDPPLAKIEKVRAVFAPGTVKDREAVPLIAHLMGIAADAQLRPLAVSPQAQRARTMAVLTEKLLALAAEHPVLVVVEDAHWIDPTTQELVDLWLDRLVDARILVLVTSRPDNPPRLGAHAHVTRLTLNRLGRSAVEAITTSLAGMEILPASVIEEIVHRTDGIPLFVEELTKAVLELAVTRQDGDPSPARMETSRLAIPSTLHDSLMARLDRLPDVKRVAQRAACIGREFEYRILAAIADLPDEQLRSALDRLVDAELLFRRGAPPEASYTFKHALVRDAAANSLLLSERRRIHVTITRVLEAAGPAVPPELVAQHAELAGLADRAIEHWLRAGRAAAARYANLEAVRHLEHALRLTRAQPQSPERDRLELAALVALGVPQIAVRGYASTEVETTFRRARDLAEHLGDREALFKVLRGLWNCVFDRADLPQALAIAEALLALGRQRGDPISLALGHRALGTTRFNRGELAQALDAFQHGIESAQRLGNEGAGVAEFGEPAGIVCRGYAGWTLVLMGEPDRGMRMCREAVAAARGTGHPVTIAFMCCLASLALIAIRGAHECAATTEEGFRIAREHLLVFWLAGADITGGWVMAMTGQPGTGIERLRKGLAAWQEIGTSLHVPTYHAFLADALLAAGSLEETRDVVSRGLQIARSTGDHVMLSDLWRLGGLAASRLGQPDEGERWLTQARETAAAQGARLLELRAARDLARCQAERGDRARARALLAPVLASFTEGLDAPDLVEARALLDSLN